ncbi:hypothetical protein KMW28_12640 [Flammeovirga yaeyamensis]|uniref:Uncharacterized protein n=1 Tax=Flammeovirga yaeyamensis TaxID=367791 RepID=A0AAX1N2Y2_9BACT|nr:hypothetical protein [Flammeovirga yaeyamensis]MBB3695984.1 hypothetical protein [Flammeovirga yaeyamensis]NMF34670.1 hypothetical protein [Flammeovirga yaeyamensis]QWG00500.1 hypothetical protein KMW28_12640 [Flammeovirga yaeyamensis]
MAKITFKIKKYDFTDPIDNTILFSISKLTEIKQLAMFFSFWSNNIIAQSIERLNNWGFIHFDIESGKIKYTDDFIKLNMMTSLDLVSIDIEEFEREKTITDKDRVKKILELYDQSESFLALSYSIHLKILKDA